MTESTDPGFVLDEGKAAQWIARVIAQAEGSAADARYDQSLPDITGAYSPRSWDNSGAAFALVAAARDEGIITGPGTIDFELSGGDGEAGYVWLLRVGAGDLKVVSLYEDLADIGDDDTTGAAAAMSVLREAVRAANTLLDDVAGYVTALPLAVRAPEIADLAARLPRGEWGADELGTVAEWLAGHGHDLAG